MMLYYMIYRDLWALLEQKLSPFVDGSGYGAADLSSGMDADVASLLEFYRDNQEQVCGRPGKGKEPIEKRGEENRRG